MKAVGFKRAVKTNDHHGWHIFKANGLDTQASLARCATSRAFMISSMSVIDRLQGFLSHISATKTYPSASSQNSVSEYPLPSPKIFFSIMMRHILLRFHNNLTISPPKNQMTATQERVLGDGHSTNPTRQSPSIRTSRISCQFRLSVRFTRKEFYHLPPY